MTYQLRQRIEDIGDFDPDGLADFFEQKTDLRLVFDLSSGDYFLLEDSDAPPRQPEVPIIDQQRLPLDLEPGVDDTRNPFTLDEDGIFDGLSKGATGGVAQVERVYHGDDSNAGDCQ